MKGNILLKTNVIVCTIIVVGFITTSFIGYQSNMGIFKKDVEHVSDLTSEGICHEIDAIFTRPVDVSLTMANDSLLKDFLAHETRRLDDAAFLRRMRAYLSAYHEKYAFDSVFLVSAQTRRYYHFNGVDRVLQEGEPENVWYYDFLDAEAEAALNIDNDEAAQDEITVFVNCKIKDGAGKVLGVVGVGFATDHIQALLREYEAEFGVQAYLIDPAGMIEMSAKQTGYQRANLFESHMPASLKEKVLGAKGAPEKFWYAAEGGEGYAVVKYLPNLNWYLVVDHDTSELNRRLSYQFYKDILIIVLIILFVLFTITRVIRRYNQKIVSLTLAREKRDYAVLQEATKLLYENIYEIDITHNCAAGKSVKHYFESLGIPAATPYDEALKIIARKEIKEEFRQGYLDTFSPDKVLDAYYRGIKRLTYEFMISSEGEAYSWVRITACIFFWNDDQSVRLTAYRQNIDAEKRREIYLFEQVQSDLLTKLYNKAATQERISEILLQKPKGLYAFLILDIDDFKQVNDRFGHAAGDFVLCEFAAALKGEFKDTGIVGRIGGDEFVVFLPVLSKEWIEEKARLLVLALHRTLALDAGKCGISASIGVALYPDCGGDFESLYKNADTALYTTKRNGKNGFTLYGSSLE